MQKHAGEAEGRKMLSFSTESPKVHEDKVKLG